MSWGRIQWKQGGSLLFCCNRSPRPPLCLVGGEDPDQRSTWTFKGFRNCPLAKDRANSITHVSQKKAVYNRNVCLWLVTWLSCYLIVCWWLLALTGLKIIPSTCQEKNILESDFFQLPFLPYCAVSKTWYFLWKGYFTSKTGLLCTEYSGLLNIAPGLNLCEINADFLVTL